MEQPLIDSVIEWAPYIIGAVAPVVIDTLAGMMPDRWVPYIGLARRIVEAIKKGRGKR